MYKEPDLRHTVPGERVYDREASGDLPFIPEPGLKTKARTVIVDSSARLSWWPCASQSASAELASGGQAEARKKPGSGEASIGER
jgi:hypothetical protein